jgi:riboflavin kinase/FMN adenylyltransferase
MVAGKPGVMNIGMRPTAGGGRSIEVHLLNWQGNLYDQEIVVELVKYIRGERRFDSFEELKAQIQRDCDVVAESLG